MDKESFGSDIKKIREEKGISLQQLGDRAGFSKSYISMIENGKLKSFPKPETLQKIAVGLDIDYHALMLAAGYIDGREFTRIKIYDFEEEEKTDGKFVKDIYFDFFQLNRKDYELYYKGKLITNEQVKDIIKFIENFILKDGE